VVPSYTIAGRNWGAGVDHSHAEAWLARLRTDPAALFVIPVFTDRSGLPVADPHAAAREAIARRAVAREHDDVPLPAPERKHRRKHWQSPARSHVRNSVPYRALSFTRTSAGIAAD
jgi:hypothetical protein